MTIQKGDNPIIGAVGGSPVIVRKASDQTVNNSTTLVDDSELVLPVKANEVWQFELYLKTNSSAAADLDFAFTIPAGGALEYAEYRRLKPGEANGETEATLSGDGSDEIGAALLYLYVGGATAGNVQLQWAQHAAEVSDTKVLTNSYIIAHRLA